MADDEPTKDRLGDEPITCYGGTYDGKGGVVMGQVTIPALKDCIPGTVLVRGLYASLCGSDALYVERLREIDHCPGGSVHEVVGEIVAIKEGSDSHNHKIGDVVLALPSNYMQSGIFRDVPTDVAENLRSIPLTGGLSQYFLSHVSHMYAIPSDTAVPCQYFTAAQPIGTILWMLRQAPKLLYQDVAIVGQGQNGQLLTHLVSNMGARRVIAIDLFEFRAQTALKMKATHAVQGSLDNPSQVIEEVKRITGGKGPDIVFEMVGHQEETVNFCLDLVRAGGTIIAFGVPKQPNYQMTFGKLFRKNLRLVGSCFPVAHEDFPFGVELIAQKRMDVAPVFTTTYCLDESPKAFEAFFHGKDKCLKILIDLQKLSGDA